MSDSQPLANIPAAPSTEATTTTTELPVAVIIVIVVGAYLVLVVFILAIRHCLVKRGMTCNCCSVCAKEGPIQCCECCITLSEACTCTLPNVTRCLDSICPNKKVSCVDIILCQCCCAGQGGGPCGSPGCCCNCEVCPEGDVCNCCCFEIKLKQGNPNYPTQHLTTGVMNTVNQTFQHQTLQQHQPTSSANQAVFMSGQPQHQATSSGNQAMFMSGQPSSSHQARTGQPSPYPPPSASPLTNPGSSGPYQQFSVWSQGSSHQPKAAPRRLPSSKLQSQA